MRNIFYILKFKSGKYDVDEDDKVLYGRKIYCWNNKKRAIEERREF